MSITEKTGIVFSLAVGFLMASGLLFAHHSEAFVDKEHIVIVRGIVTEHQFINPHTIIRFRAKSADGQSKIWTIQGSPAGGMRQYGWTKDTLKPGDELTVRMFACKSARPCGSWVMLSKADGTVLPTKGIDKRFLAKYLQTHGNEISNEEYQLYKKYVTTGPAALPYPAKSPKVVADPTQEKAY